MQIHHFPPRTEAFASGEAAKPGAILGFVHEMGLAAEIHRIARQTADSNGGGPLELVKVAVGELAAVEPDLLDYAWRAVVAGTADDAAILLVEWKRASQHCSSCGEIAERAAGSWLRLCPRCAGPLAVAGGDELEVRRVSFTAQAAAGGAR